MSEVKIVKMSGMFDVQGIVNFNGGEAPFWDKSNPKHKNHKYAKYNASGIDYTSSNCLRQAMFSELVPFQPDTEKAKNEYPKFMGSLAGLLRSGMDANDSRARRSPLTVLDAYTVADTSQIVFEQNSSSKVNESSLTNKKGEKASDTSIFSTDSVGKRQQSLNMVINLSELQFLYLDGQRAVVSKKDEKVLVDGLKETFSSLGVSDVVEIKEYTHVSGITARGILFSNEQIVALIGSAIKLMENVAIYRKGASLEVKKSSVSYRVVTRDGEESIDKAGLENLKVHYFWK